jgi:hypothetical protein
MPKKKSAFEFERASFDIHPQQRPFSAIRRFVLKHDPRGMLPIARITESFTHHFLAEGGTTERLWTPIRVMSIRTCQLIPHPEMLHKLGGLAPARLSAEIVFRLMQMHGVFGGSIGPLLRNVYMSNIFYVLDRFGDDVIVEVVFTGNNEDQGWVLDAMPVSQPKGCIPTGSRVFYPAAISGALLPDVTIDDADLVIGEDEP